MSLVLVVGDNGDAGVRAAVAAAAARVPSGRLRWVSGAGLAAADWLHTVDRSGVASTRIGPADAPLVEAGGTYRTWYRATTPAPPRRWADPRDAAYAAVEAGALLVSWLRQPSAGAVNRVDGGSPWGPSWSTALWRAAGVRAGLAVAPLCGASSARLVPGARVAPTEVCGPYRPPERSPDGVGGSRSVLVVGDRVVDAGTPREAAGCRELATAAGCTVLEIAFDARGRMEAAQPLARIDTAARIAAVANHLVSVAS